jgi:lipid-binding SYLF domain-containing protein
MGGEASVGFQPLGVSATMAALSSFSDNLVSSYSAQQCLRTGDKQWRQS